MFNTAAQFSLIALKAEQGINLGDALTLGIGQGRVKDVYSTPADLVNTLVPFAFIAGGIVLFLLVVYSGFLFIQDTSKGKEEAVKIWTNAGIGFIVMFIAYWVVRVIGVIIGQPIL